MLTSKTSGKTTCLSLCSRQAPSFPSGSLRSNEGITLPVPRFKTNAGTRAFHSCVLSLGTTSVSLSIQALQLQPSGTISTRICLLSHPNCYLHEESQRFNWDFLSLLLARKKAVLFCHWSSHRRKFDTWRFVLCTLSPMTTRRRSNECITWFVI